MKITHISDTVGYQNIFHPKQGDVLIHSGDITSSGTIEEVEDFLRWIKNQPFEHKIFIAGDRDSCFDYILSDIHKGLDIYELLHDYGVNGLSSDIHYLENDSLNIWGVNFFGSPITGKGSGLAFKKYKSLDIYKGFLASKPKKVDVLITHCPPKYTCDFSGIMKDNLGSEELRIITKLQPTKVCCFGHVPDGYGIYSDGETLFINASAFSHAKPTEQILFEIDEETKKVFMDEAAYPINLSSCDIIN